MKMSYFGIFPESSYQYKKSLDRIMSSITLDGKLLVTECLGAIKINEGNILFKQKIKLPIEVVSNSDSVFIINTNTNKALKVTDGNFFIYKDSFIIHTDLSNKFIELLNFNIPSNFDYLDAMNISTLVVKHNSVFLNVSDISYTYKRDFSEEDINTVYNTKFTANSAGKLTVKGILQMI